MGTYIECFSKIQKDANTVHIFIYSFGDVVNYLQQIFPVPAPVPLERNGS
jgi:hypothetical protein